MLNVGLLTQNDGIESGFVSSNTCLVLFLEVLFIIRLRKQCCPVHARAITQPYHVSTVEGLAQKIQSVSPFDGTQGKKTAFVHD